MNGELAQIAALVAHARAASAGEPFSLSFSNSTFKFVRDVNFEQETRRFFRKPVVQQIGASPAEWYAHVSRSGAPSVTLVLGVATGPLADHVAVAFSGGGGWAVGVVQNGEERLWRANWQVADRNAPDRRIWSVLYRELPCAPFPAQGATVAPRPAGSLTS